MKNEIKIRSIEKQAIDNLKAIINSKDKIIEIEPPLEDTSQILLDYIINLEQENEKLKKQNIKLYKKDIKEINKLKLKQTKEVFDKLAYLINTNETCSYRFLIYDLLGFQKKDHIDLISGLVITNMLVDYQDYKSRNEKAIEYGKELRLFDNESLECEIGTNFINILKGSDKK